MKVAAEQDNLRFVLGKLAERMVTTRRRQETGVAARDEPGVVFVIGAGCSMQYGLPGFVDLLRYSYDDLHLRGEVRDEAWGLESLRDRLDPHWRTAKPAELRRLLERYLNRTSGERCTGYLRLAWLARNGYVRAIVNMNFDLLLEQALGIVEGSRSPHFSRAFKLNDPSWAEGDQMVVYTPHGSMDSSSSPDQVRRGVPILDLASSDLFDSKDETDAANALFRQNDVVFLGYSGADAKIAAALTPNKIPTDKEEVDGQNYNQIFVLNVTTPNPRLLRIVVARRSTDLIVTGDSAAFENVMEELHQAVRDYKKILERSRDHVDPRSACGGPPDRASAAASPRTDRRPIPNSRHFTIREAEALDRCRKLALYLRSTMSVAEGGRIGIEDHASDIFALCLKLARVAGVGLTTPEKYLLYCAAYLHDLGYFWAHSGSRRYTKSGWALLTFHGPDTAKLLSQVFPRGRATKDPPEHEILPEKYRGQAKELIDTLLLLCHLHSQGPIPRFPDEESMKIGDRPVHPRTCFQVQIDDFSIPVRPPLLHALFSTAEELTQGHPFFPSPHTLEHDISRLADGPPQDGVPLEDPVLDIYLRRKSQVMDFHIERESVVLIRRTPAPREAAEGDDQVPNQREVFVLLASLADAAMQALDKAARKEGGWGVRLRCIDCGEPDGDPRKIKLVPPELLHIPAGAALDEQLCAQLLLVQKGAEKDSSNRVELLPSVLDLLTIYTDPIFRWNGNETAPHGTEPPLRGIAQARQMLEDYLPAARKHLIFNYMDIRYWSRGKGEFPLMQEVFCTSFEEIYRPAWRFCADKWLYGIDALVMARASLDFGSSRFRDEVVLGLRKLLEDKITWCSTRDHDVRQWRKKEHRERWRENEMWAFGHDGCTICSARLLYILASARALLPRELRQSLGEEKRGLDEATAAILRYMIRRDPEDPCWWGIEEEQRTAEREKRPDQPLHSADYLAWAVKATAHVVAMDHEIRWRTDGKESWLSDECGIDPDAVVRLFREQWRALAGATGDDLLSGRTEEPHSYILGQVALTYLYVLDLDLEVRTRLLGPDHDLSEQLEMLRAVVEEFNPRNPAQLSQFFVWPAEVLLAWTTEPDDTPKRSGEKTGDELLVDKLESCLKSRVWIDSGEGRGSWGYNIENTQRIVSSLNAFWRLAFEKPERFGRIIENRPWKRIVGATVNPPAGQPPRASGTPRSTPARPGARGKGGRRTRS